MECLSTIHTRLEAHLPLRTSIARFDERLVRDLLDKKIITPGLTDLGGDPKQWLDGAVTESSKILKENAQAIFP